MFTQINPKLPMRSKQATKDYYTSQLGFVVVGDYPGYLIIEKSNLQIHFFEFTMLDPKENYGQVYIRTSDIDGLYKLLLDNNTLIHPNGPLQNKPWGMREFSLLDPDNNLLTFGQSV